MTCSFHVSLLFNLSIKLLSELMILSFMLINFRFVVNFDLHKHEKFWFSIFDLQHSHLWSYWVEWELVLIIRLCSITCQSIWYIICFNRLLSSSVFVVLQYMCVCCRQCEVIWWHTTRLDQFTSESVSNLHTVNIKLQEHYWERKSRSIDQKRCSRIIIYRQHESNHHKLRQKANLQRDEITMIKCLKKQHQEEKSVSKAHIECEFKS